MSSTVMKAEHQRVNALKLWFRRRLLRVPWTKRRSNQLILNQPWIFFARIDAEVPIIWPPDAKSWLTGKHPDAVKDWGQKEKGVAEDEVLSITDSLDMNLSQFQPIVEDRRPLKAAVHGFSKSWTQLSSWNTTTKGNGHYYKAWVITAGKQFNIV